MWIIGDYHGDYDWYANICQQADEKNSHTLQLGDFFDYTDAGIRGRVNTLNHKMIRGNHDNPEFCYSYDGYLGDYGYIPEMKLFYISGAFSFYDMGHPWKDDEELSVEKFEKALELFRKSKPLYVVSHDAPSGLVSKMLWQKLKGNPASPNRTGNYMDQMLYAYQPKVWFFGHHHKPYATDHLGTHFRCVGEGEVIKVFELDKWELKNEN